MGGKLSSAYDEKKKLLLVALSLGLILVGTSIGLTHILSLRPLYLCVLLLGLTFGAGKMITLKSKREPEEREIPTQGRTTDEEIKSMLEKRGLGRLIEKEENHPEE